MRNPTTLTLLAGAAVASAVVAYMLAPAGDPAESENGDSLPISRRNPSQESGEMEIGDFRVTQWAVWRCCQCPVILGLKSSWAGFTVIHALSRTIRTLTFKKLGPLAAPHATCPRPRAARSYHASNAPDLTRLGP